MLQRCVFEIVDLAVQDCVPMKKCSAGAVLPDEAALKSLTHQRCIGHGLGKSPVHVDITGQHTFTIIHDALHSSMQLHVLRIACNYFADSLNSCRTNRCVDRLIPTRIQERRPVHGIFVTNHT